MLLNAACPGIHSQLTALTSGTPAPTSTPGGGAKPRSVGGVWKGPTPILLRAGQTRHEAPSVPSSSRGLTLPKVQWNDHGRATSGPFEDGGHQRSR